MVARISWWPETSSRVSGRYFSTLPMILASQCCINTSNHVPWKTVFGLNWQISSTSLAFRVGVVGIEHYLVIRRWRINVHIIFVVWHLGGWGSWSWGRSERGVEEGDAFFEARKVLVHPITCSFTQPKFHVPSRLSICSSTATNKCSPIVQHVGPFLWYVVIFCLAIGDTTSAKLLTSDVAPFLTIFWATSIATRVKYYFCEAKRFRNFPSDAMILRARNWCPLYQFAVVIFRAEPTARQF